MDLDFIRGIYEVHNAAGPEFPAILARDYLHADAEFVEAPTLMGGGTHRGREAVEALFRERFEQGAMRIDDLSLVAVDERRALAAFRIRIRGTASGAEASMRLWSVITVDGGRIRRIEEYTDPPFV